MVINFEQEQEPKIKLADGLGFNCSIANSAEICKKSLFQVSLKVLKRHIFVKNKALKNATTAQRCITPDLVRYQFNEVSRI